MKLSIKYKTIISRGNFPSFFFELPIGQAGSADEAMLNGIGLALFLDLQKQTYNELFVRDQKI